MEAEISSLTDELESLTGVDGVEAYLADYDLSSPDIIAVSGGVEEEIHETIKEALNEDEACLEMENGSFMLYRPLGVVDEHDGSKFDILAYDESRIEAVLVDRASHETASVGTVLRFGRGDTDYDVTLYDDE